MWEVVPAGQVQTRGRGTSQVVNIHSGSAKSYSSVTRMRKKIKDVPNFHTK